MRHLSGVYYALAVQALPDSGPKFTCVVSKKTAPRAVDRNLVKRKCLSILRAAIRGETRPLAFIVRAKPSALHARHTELKDDLHSLLARLGR